MAIRAAQLNVHSTAADDWSDVLYLANTAETAGYDGKLKCSVAMRQIVDGL